MHTLAELRELYRRGVNISQLLMETAAVRRNTEASIAIAYDLQSGSYVELMRDASHRAFQDAYNSEIAKVIKSYCRPVSILEAGVGEATTLAGVVSGLGECASFGLDGSWSRIFTARKWVTECAVPDVGLCVGSMTAMPYGDNAFDVVYTSHSIEPNGGREREILAELYRVAGSYLMLLEPSFELADSAGRERMNRLGYCTELQKTIDSLGYEVVEHRLFGHCCNPLNPTALTVIRKATGTSGKPVELVCPVSRGKLRMIKDAFYCAESLLAYPMIAGIPCLKPENGIIASLLEDAGA